MDQSASDADCQKIEQIGGLNAESQCDVVKDDLRGRIVGGYVEHICLTVTGSENIDQSCNYAADCKDWECPHVAAP